MSKQSHALYFDIMPGCYLVHVRHGIARFTGITTISATIDSIKSIKKEYLVLEYAGGDKFYVPTDRIDRISRYIGATDRPPVLRRLGIQKLPTLWKWSRVRRTHRIRPSYAVRNDDDDDSSVWVLEPIVLWYSSLAGL